MEQKKYKIAFICNGTASRLWRILPIANYLHSKGFLCKVLNSRDGFNFKMLDGADLVVLEMVFDGRIIKWLRKNKIKFVFEMDDLIHWVPKDHYAKDIINWSWIYQTFKAIIHCDALTLSCQYLNKVYGKLRIFKGNSYVLPNYIDNNIWLRPYNPNKSGIIRVGYVGGNSHKKDLDIIKEPLKAILKEYDNVRFITMGTGGLSSEENPLVEYNHGNDLFKDIPKGKRQCYLGADMSIYPDKLNSLQLDIGLAPLRENKFTKSKTPIKWMEYALNKTPSICQKFLYKQVINNGVNGFLANTEEDYYKYLKMLIDDKALRIKMGINAFNDVMTKYSFNEHAFKWLEVYNKVLNIK